MGSIVPSERMRIPCTVSSPHDVASAWVSPPSSNVVTNPGFCSRNFRELSLCGPVTERIASRVPFSWMRISWIPLSPCEATAAYMFPFTENVETPCELRSVPKSSSPSNAELTASRVPFSWMRINWTPLSPLDATIAYMLLFIMNAETSFESVSASKLLDPFFA